MQGVKQKNNNPGPGSYQETRSIERSTNENLKGATDGAMMGQEPASFLSKTERGEFWKHEGATPYTR